MFYKKMFWGAFVISVIATGILACSESNKKSSDKQERELKIAVISDLHYFDLSLLESKGTAFEQYVMSDRKLIEESSSITEALVNSLITEKPDMVLVCGDLTKDGEKKSHEGLIGMLDRLRKSDIAVLVVPGNHDVNNPHSFSYNGSDVKTVPSVSADEFRVLYNDYGFGGALSSGPGLCYVAEPAEGLWIIGIDACEYDDNISLGTPVTRGSLSSEKLDWVLEKTMEGVSKGKQVFGLMHHGMLEHFEGQSVLFSEYVVDGWQDISSKLAEAGMKVVFTGHFHAQDIVKKTVDSDKFIFDIETGSTVTAPCPYRIITLSPEGVMNITTKTIQSINFSGIPQGVTFPQYAGQYLYDGMLMIASYMLMSPPYSLPEEQAGMLAPLIGETFTAHYGGDETEPSAQTRPVLDMLIDTPAYAVIGQSILAIWNDPAPADNDINIDLNTGQVLN